MNKPSKLPGFDESLRLLVQRERYSLFDIGMMFGISKQSVHQFCVKHGIEHPDGGRGLNAVRVWDDARNCFAPQLRSTLRRKERCLRRESRRAERVVGMIARRARIVATMRDLADGLGREPTWREIWLAIGGNESHAYGSSATRVLDEWGPRTAPLWERRAAFRSATGLRGRPSGTLGHLKHSLERAS